MHNEISFTFKEKQNSYLYRQMDETEKAYPESGNSGPEKHTLCSLSYIGPSFKSLSLCGYLIVPASQVVEKGN